MYLDHYKITQEELSKYTGLSDRTTSSSCYIHLRLNESKFQLVAGLTALSLMLLVPLFVHPTCQDIYVELDNGRERYYKLRQEFYDANQWDSNNRNPFDRERFRRFETFQEHLADSGELTFSEITDLNGKGSFCRLRRWIITPVVVGGTGFLAGYSLSLFSFWILYKVKPFFRSKSLKKLQKKVLDYNSSIKQLQVLYELKMAGNPVELPDETKTIELLRGVRNNLVIALKTERVLRENPDFNPQNFSFNTSIIEAEEIQDKATSYSQILTNMVELNASIKREIDNLNNL